MRILIIHPESKYYAGAERMLEYYLAEIVTQPGHEITIATTRDCRLAKALTAGIKPIWIEDNQPFSIHRLWQQATILNAQHRQSPFDVIHSWAARDWELATLTRYLIRRPALGTLHDHPRAAFITATRHWLMELGAVYGLDKVACVSDAVRRACEAAGYPEDKLTVVRNGLPDIQNYNRHQKTSRTCQLGFLGILSERKGLRLLLQTLEQLAATGETRWELHVGGNPHDADGEKLLSDLRERYQSSPWWKQIHWHGWVESPRDFLGKLDLLIAPSSEFDPFPTVLLEAGQLGLPVLATNLGGAGEIVFHDQTGWLIEPGDTTRAVRVLRHFIANPETAANIGQQASARIQHDFSASKMVAEYLKLYSTLPPNG